MGLKSSKGVESNTGQETKVFRTGNLGQSVGGAAGGGGGGSGNQFTMQIMTPTGVDGGITTHNSLNPSDGPFPAVWTSGPDAPRLIPPGDGNSNKYTAGYMWKFTSASACDIQVSMWGGGGASAPSNGGRGGNGGFVSATLTVTPGMELYIVQAEGGGGKFYPTQPNTDTTYSPFGNFHGGSGPRGNGGGFSGVFVGSDPTDIAQGNAVLMAAGGGGSGGAPTSGPAGIPGGGLYGAPSGWPAPNGNALGGTPTAGGDGSKNSTRTEGGAGEAMLGGGHPETTPSFAAAGGGAGYYGGGGAGDTCPSGGAGGAGYVGGHPTVPVANAKNVMSNYDGSPNWPSYPTNFGSAPWPEVVGPVVGYGNFAGSGGNGPGGDPAPPNAPWMYKGKAGKVVIEVLND